MSILFVDDELDNVTLAASILRDALDVSVQVCDSVESAVGLLHEKSWQLVVMDLFIPLGEHPSRVLGPRARRYQDQVEHLGGLVLLEEIDRLPGAQRPTVISHTACTDHVLLELFGDRVARRIPKPSPMDTVLQNIMEVLDEVRRASNPFG